MRSLTLFNKKMASRMVFLHKKGQKVSKRLDFWDDTSKLRPLRTKKNKFFLYSAHLFAPLSLLRNLEITPSQHKKE